jgi:ABC-type dipeptide/oligopeptide/nickel transport system ATPase component
VFKADGAIVEEAPPDRFFTQPKDERTRQFLGQILSSHQPHPAHAHPPQPIHLPQQPILP